MLLGTGGGIVKALPLLGNAPFFLVNSDTLWLDGVRPNFARLAEDFDPAQMDALLLLAPRPAASGMTGRGDFAMVSDGRLRRRVENEIVPFVYAGAAVLSPSLFADAPAGAFPLTRAVRPRRRERASVRVAPRRRLDACRHAGGGGSRRRGAGRHVLRTAPDFRPARQ